MIKDKILLECFDAFVLNAEKDKNVTQSSILTIIFSSLSGSYSILTRQHCFQLAYSISPNPKISLPCYGTFCIETSVSPTLILVTQIHHKGSYKWDILPIVSYVILSANNQLVALCINYHSHFYSLIHNALKLNPHISRQPGIKKKAISQTFKIKHHRCKTVF